MLSETKSRYARKKLIKILFFFLMVTQICSAQWFWQNPLPQGNSLSSVYFTDSNTGWVVGSCGTILKTTDGGENWSQQISGFDDNFHSTFFVNENTGWAVGSSGTIVKTTDGGDNWFYQNSGTNEYLFAVDFINQNTGWVVGDGIVLRTTDSGNNWEPQISGTNEFYFSVSFASSTTWMDCRLGWYYT